MGTNYFLVRDTDIPVCRSCGSNPTALHIGKSSIGWAFTWQGYRKGDGVTSYGDLSLTTVADWFAFLAEQCAHNWRIEDQHDRPKDLAAFRELVENKRGGRQQTAEYGRDCNVDPTGDSVAFYHFS